ncbi:hypothetical protein [uncultured Butyricimonas sp.]|uniref:hypothetical protein n=1 Tax=uncultured Butyricimonas sp. TaxID=1268785 RepID=UPI0026DAFF08|nr:hypothetical protein [uncultured Butyricimonas sp.]
MKRVNYFIMIVFCGLSLCGCEKVEEQKTENAVVTYETLEKEYGIHFTEVENDGTDAVPMSLNELKMFLESLEKLNGKKIEANVTREPALSRGEASFVGSIVRIEEGNINLGRLVKIRVDYYQEGKYFYTYVYEQSSGTTLYRGTRNTKVHNLMYGGVIYKSFEESNCTVNIINGSQTTTINFRLQVDWDLDTDHAEFTLFTLFMS